MPGCGLDKVRQVMIGDGGVWVESFYLSCAYRPAYIIAAAGSSPFFRGYGQVPSVMANKEAETGE